MKPHKHAELIKAWADGAEIEFRKSFHVAGPGGGTCFTDWKSKLHDSWQEHIQYRIKPKPKPDVVYYFEVDKYKNFHQIDTVAGMSNLKLIFDGETGKLKSAEVLK